MAPPPLRDDAAAAETIDICEVCKVCTHISGQDLNLEDFLYTVLSCSGRDKSEKKEQKEKERMLRKTQREANILLAVVSAVVPTSRAA